MLGLLLSGQAPAASVPARAASDAGAQANGAPAAAIASALPEVVGVRVGVNQGNTRFVLETSGRVTFTISRASEPYRLVIDTSEVAWKNNPGNEGAGKGIVEKYRFGQFSPGATRIVLDLKNPAKVVHSFIIPPRDHSAYRLVIDLGETTRDDFMKLVKASAAAPGKPEAGSSTVNPGDNPDDKTADNAARKAVDSAPAKNPPRDAESAGKIYPATRKTIVIDPGHGGIDPGSPSVTGVYEKVVTLAAAKAVRDTLNASGRYRAILTRDSDIFIPLRQRFEIARRKKADLFISFHADSHANSAVRGATVYTLSERASDREAAALAAKENKADLIAGINLGGETPEVSNILIDLAQHETMNYSSHFANLLVGEFKDEIALGRNSHRFAGFVVLKAPDIPSVLVEMGYLSNREDAALLNSPAHQKTFSEAVLRAIDDYFTQVAVR